MNVVLIRQVANRVTSWGVIAQDNCSNEGVQTVNVDVSLLLRNCLPIDTLHSQRFRNIANSLELFLAERFEGDCVGRRAGVNDILPLGEPRSPL